MEYLSTREVMSLFGWTTRASVSRVAIQERWDKIPGSRPRHYLARDVQDYILTRKHTDLARRSGIVFKGLFRHIDGIGATCPICRKRLDK